MWSVKMMVFDGVLLYVPRSCMCKPIRSKLNIQWENAGFGSGLGLQYQVCLSHFVPSKKSTSGNTVQIREHKRAKDICSRILPCLVAMTWQDALNKMMYKDGLGSKISESRGG